MGKKNKDYDSISSEEIVIIKQNTQCNKSSSFTGSNSRPTFETEPSSKEAKPKMNKIKKLVVSAFIMLITVFIINRYL
jgi:hypothetical protein